MYLAVSSGLRDMETVAEEDAEPPDPEHSIVNVLSPTLSKDNDSVPEVDFVPLQSPLAVQVDVLVDDQVTETASYTYAESGSMEIEAVGAGVGVGIGVEAVSYTHLTLPTILRV